MSDITIYHGSLFLFDQSDLSGAGEGTGKCNVFQKVGKFCCLFVAYHVHKLFGKNDILYADCVCK